MFYKYNKEKHKTKAQKANWNHQWAEKKLNLFGNDS